MKGRGSAFECAFGGDASGLLALEFLPGEMPLGLGEEAFRFLVGGDFFAGAAERFWVFAVERIGQFGLMVVEEQLGGFAVDVAIGKDAGCFCLHLCGERLRLRALLAKTFCPLLVQQAEHLLFDSVERIFFFLFIRHGVIITAIMLRCVKLLCQNGLAGKRATCYNPWKLYASQDKIVQIS